MKILQINKYHYVKGGSDKVYLLTSELLQRKGHDVIHFSTQSSRNIYSPTSQFFVSNPEYLQQNKLQQIKSAYNYVYSQEAKDKLEQLILHEQPDIAHLHIFFGELSLSILTILKKYRIPTVMTLHDFKYMCPVYSFMNSKNEICEKCANGNYLHAITNRCNKNSLAYSTMAALENFLRDWVIPYEKYIDRFIAVSLFSKEKHLQYRKNLRQKITVVPNYTDIPVSHEFGHHDNYFLFFGRLSLQKGLTRLLEAFESRPSTALKIVGEGPEKDQLLTYCQKKNMDNVQFLGYRSGEELYALIRNAKFTIMPSIGYESFGLSLIESMRLGTPVVASSLGGMKELVKEGETGFSIEASDVSSLQDVIDRCSKMSDAEYEAMSKNCIQFSLGFSEENYYEKLMIVYQEALAGYHYG